jgi:DNA-binding transcriptional LysR family regulator
MDTLTSINVFRQVVESGSFVGAADRMDLSTAMVSRHVMHVEQRLGVRLLNRNTRKLSLTEPGRLYFERCKQILEELAGVEQELGSLSAAVRGTLRITAPTVAAGPRMAELLAQYRRRYPEVLVDLCLEDRLVDLVEEGYDLALRIASSRDELPAGLIARPVRSASFHLAASHEYLKRHGTPRCPEEIAGHDFVAVGNTTSLRLARPAGDIEIPLRVVMRHRSMAGVAGAVAAGVGIALLPTVLLSEPALREVVTPILTDCPFREATLYALYVSRKFVPSTIRTFIDFIVAASEETTSTNRDCTVAGPSKVAKASAELATQRLGRVAGEVGAFAAIDACAASC